MSARGRIIYAADLFCGGGGTSTALVQAAEQAGHAVDLAAVNHWDRAVETHAANHPGARHYHARIDQLDPRAVCPVGPGKLDLLVASPECTHHSRARGGVPMDDQSRASGWDVLRWVEALRPKSVLLENVIEWEKWGPLGASGKPLKSRVGETFQAFLSGLRSLNYQVEYRHLNAADFGDATTRTRIFVQARRGKGAITWPDPTHAEDPSGLFAPLEPWRPAREIIDFSVLGRSVFGREKPLSPNTMRRIAEGLRRFVGPQYADAFLVHLKGTGTARSLDRPLPCLNARGEHVALATPFIVPRYSERNGQRPRVHSVDEPFPTVPATNQHALAQPFLLSQASGGAPRPVSLPAPTFCTDGAVSLVEPFLVSFYRNGHAHGVGKPLPTATARDRFGLVQPCYLDVLFRMLQPHELAAAMGFPKGYVFKGNREDTVRMIGNAVAVNIARALCTSALAPALRAAA